MDKTIKINTGYNGYIECNGLWGCTPHNRIEDKITDTYKHKRIFSENYDVNEDLIRKALCDLRMITIEITTKCNLNCKYCVHGGLYKNNDVCTYKHLPTEHVINLIDYLVDFWEKQSPNPPKSTNIGFHGGEPLVNFKLIKEVVEYTKSIDTNIRQFSYSMFTNGVLLDKYIDYLVENKIQLSVSLDGNKFNDSYRVYANGKASFDRVTYNLDMIKDRYPDYFNSSIKFTCVLHDRNNPNDIWDFFKTRYGKLPHINELESFDINEEKRDEFQKLYSSNKTNNSQLVGELDDKIVTKYFVNRSNNVFENYNDLLHETNKRVYLTQTCQPFGKKMFLSANSELAFCQTIYKKHTAGYVSETGVHLDLREISDNYNNLVKKMLAECQECYMPEDCSQCMLKLVDSEHERPVCPKSVTKVEYTEYLSKIWKHLEIHPEAYIDFIEEYNPKQLMHE